MNQSRVFVYGAGGHGKVVADIVLATSRLSLTGFIDDRQETHGTTLLGVPVFGDRDWLRRTAQESPVAIALGVGDNYARQKLAEGCARWGIELLTAIHPEAYVARSATLGKGTSVMAGAVINAEAQLGEGVIVNTGAVIEHDVVVQDFAHVSPKAAMGGGSRLGRLSWLGLGAVVLPHVTIGSESIVGAGAVANRDLPDRVVAAGVPARIFRYREDECHTRQYLPGSEVLR